MARGDGLRVEGGRSPKFAVRFCSGAEVRRSGRRRGAGKALPAGRARRGVERRGAPPGSGCVCGGRRSRARSCGPGYPAGAPPLAPGPAPRSALLGQRGAVGKVGRAPRFGVTAGPGQGGRRIKVGSEQG